MPTTPVSTHPRESTPTSRLPSSPRWLLFAVLAGIGVGMSGAAYHYGRPDGPSLYFGILPGAPFLLLAVLSLVTRVPIRATVGAFVGSLLAIAIPYGLLLYTLATYSGGGANIGVGLLLLATPVYLPIAMVIGALFGWRLWK